MLWNARDLKAPNIAEAAPAWCLSLSIASAVVDGNINPRKSNIEKRQLSKYTKGKSLKRQNAVAMVKTSNPVLPVTILFFGSLKRMDNTEPKTIPMEFIEKQRLNMSPLRKVEAARFN